MSSSLLSVQSTVLRRASFSRCRRYRYSLTRRFSTGQGCCVMIGLNPSVANHQQDDPTIRRCMQFAYDWGHRDLIMVNLFAWCATRPEDLKQSDAPVGPRNLKVIRQSAERADRIVVAWGSDGAYRSQGRTVLKLLTDYPLSCFGVTKQHEPLHPLYQRRDAPLCNYEDT